MVANPGFFEPGAQTRETAATPSLALLRFRHPCAALIQTQVFIVTHIATNHVRFMTNLGNVTHRDPVLMHVAAHNL